uniref:Uncharacterized protein n=1 Tax=Solanum lycopersicum TaxID=4081 RepID=A0A3Q7JPB2_SOLLC
MKPDNGYYNPEKDYFQKVNLSLSCYLVRPVHRHGCFSKNKKPNGSALAWQIMTMSKSSIALILSPPWL